MLYATLGDNMVGTLAQDPNAPPGSVLRYTPDGGLPADNPHPGSPVAITGIRNAFGITFDPVLGLVLTDNGPSTFDGPAGLDEVNLLKIGDNAGWPLSRGDTNLPGHVAPLWHSGSERTGPTGVVVPRNSTRAEWDGRILFCNVNDRSARLLDPAAPHNPPTVFTGCAYDVAQDALGRIVLADNNRVHILS
jgi:aldose sugar dehydrogenase